MADAALPSAKAAMASKILSPCIFLWTCLFVVTVVAGVALVASTFTQLAI